MLDHSGLSEGLADKLGGWLGNKLGKFLSKDIVDLIDPKAQVKEGIDTATNKGTEAGKAAIDEALNDAYSPEAAASKMGWYADMPPADTMRILAEGISEPQAPGSTRRATPTRTTAATTSS